MENELFTLNHYGHIEINLREYMDKNQITRNALARAIVLFITLPVPYFRKILQIKRRYSI